MNKVMQKFEEKPYNLCLNCAHIGKRCDGPNFLAMSTERLCEWCRLRKEYLHGLDPIWTNAYVAEQAGLSKTSVDRFLSGNIGDIKASTVSQLLKVLINGSWGQYPCAMESFASPTDEDLGERARKAESRCKRLQATLDEKAARVEFLLEQIKRKDEQIAQKDRQMEDRAAFLRRKDRIMRILVTLLAVIVALIIAALIIDLSDPNIGYIRLK